MCLVDEEDDYDDGGELLKFSMFTCIQLFGMTMMINVKDDNRQNH